MAPGSPLSSSSRHVLTGLLALVLGCEKEPSKVEQMAKSATSAEPAPAPAPPPPPTKPNLAVDESGASVGGVRIDFTQPDPRGAIAAALSGKPVEGETITLDAARDTKTPKVATVFSALSGAKAKAVLVRTPKRDRTTAEITFRLGASRPDCTAAGFIGKDLGINVWSAGGGTATRFAKGMAGPDLTLGSGGLRKVMASCDAPAWLVGADDVVTWGLVVDLVLSVAEPEDGGAPKAKEVVLLTRAPVPGRKIVDE